MSRGVLLLACIATLLLMTAATFVVLRVQDQRDRLRKRVQRVTGPYQRRALAVAATTGVGLDAEEASRIGRRAARVFGFDPQLQEHYAAPWWLALLVALILALLERAMAATLLGHKSWILVLPSWIFLSRQFFGWCEGRRRTKLFVQFPDALSMIVRAVRVGVPVTQSIRAVGREVAAPTGPEFSQLADEIAIGVPLEDALRAMAERNGLAEYRFFATALALQSQTGGGLSETLDNLSEVIRKRVALRQKGEAMSSEAKTSAAVLAALPVLAGLALWVLNRDYISVLYLDPGGQKVLAAAIGMLAAGMFTMRFMIRKSLS